MTRINAGIPPKQLCRQHLLAELREIKRIPNMLPKANLKDLPTKFTLGTGHVRFFYDKGKYTLTRYLQLYHEAKFRGYNVTDFSEAWKIYEQYLKLFNDWLPGAKDIVMINERIVERLKTMKQ